MALSPCIYSLDCSVYPIALNETCGFSIWSNGTETTRALLPSYLIDTVWTYPPLTSSCDESFLYADDMAICFEYNATSTLCTATVNASSSLPDLSFISFTANTTLDVQVSKEIQNPPYYTVSNVVHRVDDTVSFTLIPHDACFVAPDILVDRGDRNRTFSLSSGFLYVSDESYRQGQIINVNGLACEWEETCTSGFTFTIPVNTARLQAFTIPVAVVPGVLFFVWTLALL